MEAVGAAVTDSSSSIFISQRYDNDLMVPGKPTDVQSMWNTFCPLVYEVSDLHEQVHFLHFSTAEIRALQNSDLDFPHFFASCVILNMKILS